MLVTSQLYHPAKQTPFDLKQTTSLSALVFVAEKCLIILYTLIVVSANSGRDAPPLVSWLFYAQLQKGGVNRRKGCYLNAFYFEKKKKALGNWKCHV